MIPASVMKGLIKLIYLMWYDHTISGRNKAKKGSRTKFEKVVVKNTGGRSLHKIIVIQCLIEIVIL